MSVCVMRCCRTPPIGSGSERAPHRPYLGATGALYGCDISGKWALCVRQVDVKWTLLGRPQRPENCSDRRCLPDRGIAARLLQCLWNDRSHRRALTGC